jgi:hypothetical protein
MAAMSSIAGMVSAPRIKKFLLQVYQLAKARICPQKSRNHE